MTLASWDGQEHDDYIEPSLFEDISWRWGLLIAGVAFVVLGIIGSVGS